MLQVVETLDWLLHALLQASLDFGLVVTRASSSLLKLGLIVTWASSGLLRLWISVTCASSSLLRFWISRYMCFLKLVEILD